METATVPHMSTASPKVFPYDLDRAMSKAINCYIADLCPSFSRRPQYQRRGVDRLFVADMVAIVVQNEVIFRSIIALARIIQMKRSPRFVSPSEEASSLLQQAYRAVRMALSRRDYLTLPDPVVWALWSFVGIFGVLEQYDQSDAHAGGLKHLIVTIGGYEALRWDETARVTKSFLDWNEATRTIRAEQRAEQRAIQDNPGSRPHLTYPFPPPSNVTLARLPDVLFKLSATNSLSMRSIQTLESIVAWNEAKPQLQPDASMLEATDQTNVVRCICMLRSQTQPRSPLTWNERLALLASAAYCIFKAGNMDSWFAANAFIQLSCRAFRDVVVYGCDESLMLWAASVLKAVYGPENHSSHFADALLAKIDSGTVDEMLQGRGTEGLYGFFWNDELTTALRQCLSSARTKHWR